jgi:hypothetical protein
LEDDELLDAVDTMLTDARVRERAAEEVPTLA